MSDIDLIREAAALMRQRAEWANEGPWERGRDWAGTYTIDADSIGTLGQGFVGTDAIHIASWHPTVALAVADWLSDIATRHEPDPNAEAPQWALRWCLLRDVMRPFSYDGCDPLHDKSQSVLEVARLAHSLWEIHTSEHQAQQEPTP
jgi:hypothetical protein